MFKLFRISMVCIFSELGAGSGSWVLTGNSVVEPWNISGQTPGILRPFLLFMDNTFTNPPTLLGYGHQRFPGEYGITLADPSLTFLLGC